MTPVLIDSNIIVDALNGIQAADVELDFYIDAAISAVTWIEVIAGVLPADLQRCQSLLSTFQVLHTSDAIMTKAANIRRSSLLTRPKIALADSIILATAALTGRIVVTRNSKDFRGQNVRIPYELVTTTTVKAVNVQPPLP